MSKNDRDRWLKRLKQEEDAHKDWRTKAQEATDAYFAEQGSAKNAYPLFWPTVKVTHGRIYSQPPKPDVRKRYADEDAAKPAGGQPSQPGVGADEAEPAGALPANPQQPPNAAPNGSPAAPQQPTVDDNKLAQCMERALGYVIDTTEFDADGHMAVNDLLVAALGIAKIEMDTETEKRPVINPVTGAPIMLDKASGTPYDPSIHVDEPIPALEEVIAEQTLRLRHFSHTQFRWEPQQHWSQVSWIGFDHWMTADEIKDQFKKEISTSNTEGGGGYNSSKPDSNKYKEQFKVSEIWDKKSKRRLFVSESCEEMLGDDEDPLGLKAFFPCPKPMLLNVRGDDLVPTPDYAYCEEMFKYCTTLTNRINRLTNQIKDIGFYDGGFPELAQLPNQQDGNRIPIANLAQRLATLGGSMGKGFESIVAVQDNTGKVAVLQELVQLRDLQKQAIWEIYGISDIQRGSTDPNETATAQNIKSEWANVRVGERIRIVALFFRDVFRIMAEIMAEKFEPDILEKMTGLELNEEEIEVLRSDYGRCYAIDVESDSTVVQDESAEKANRLEFLNTVSGFIQQLLPAITQNVIPADLGKEMLLFAVNTFKNGRQLEQSINNLPDTMSQLTQLSTTNQQSQQQIQSLTQQLQQLQQQLQKVNAGKEQRDNVTVAADAQKKDAETQRTQLESANLAQDLHSNTLRPVDHQQVVPMRRP